MQLLQAVASPEDAPQHIQVLAELFNTTWKGHLRKAMTYTLKEVQFSASIEQVAQALSARGPDVVETWQNAWSIMVSPSGWSQWNVHIRPCVIKRLRETALAHLTDRLVVEGDGTASSEDTSETVRLCCWIETHDADGSVQWARLHQKARDSYPLVFVCRNCNEARLNARS